MELEHAATFDRGAHLETDPPRMEDRDDDSHDRYGHDHRLELKPVDWRRSEVEVHGSLVQEQLWWRKARLVTEDQRQQLRDGNQHANGRNDLRDGVARCDVPKQEAIQRHT